MFDIIICLATITLLIVVAIHFELYYENVLIRNSCFFVVSAVTFYQFVSLNLGV